MTRLPRHRRHSVVCHGDASGIVITKRWWWWSLIIVMVMVIILPSLLKLVHIWNVEYFLWQAPMIFDEYLQKTICKCRKLDSGAFGRPIADWTKGWIQKRKLLRRNIAIMGGGGHMVKKSYHKIGRWFWEEDCSGEGEYQWFWEEDKKEIVEENIRMVSERGESWMRSRSQGLL